MYLYTYIYICIYIYVYMYVNTVLGKRTERSQRTQITIEKGATNDKTNILASPSFLWSFCT